MTLSDGWVGTSITLERQLAHAMAERPRHDDRQQTKREHSPIPPDLAGRRRPISEEIAAVSWLRASEREAPGALRSPSPARSDFESGWVLGSSWSGDPSRMSLLWDACRRVVTDRGELCAAVEK